MQGDKLWHRIRSLVNAAAIGADKAIVDRDSKTLRQSRSDKKSQKKSETNPVRLRFSGWTQKREPRILLLTSELGCGHARAAQAIRTAILQQSPSAKVCIVDWWSLMNSSVAHAVQEMYLRLVQEYPELYERLYHLGEGTWREMLSSNQPLPTPVLQLFELIKRVHADPESFGPSRGPYVSDRTLFTLFCTAGVESNVLVAGGMRAKLALMKWSWARLARRLELKIKRFRPDVIVSTQMIPAALVSTVKQRRGLDIPSVAVPTDFGVHDFWNQTGTDLYCLGHESLVELSGGIDKQKILVTGFPLMPEFAKPIDATQARQHLGLKNDGIPVILVLGGGLGLGVDKVTERLLQANANMHLLVLPARNEGARAALDALSARFPSKIQIFDWTERMDIFIRAADLVVGKPGGLTVAEILACSRPLLATRSLRGQEGFNVRFLEKHQVGQLLSDQDLVSQIESFLEQPFELAALQARAWVLGRRDGAYRIAERILQLTSPHDVLRNVPRDELDKANSRWRIGEGRVRRRALAKIDEWYRHKYQLDSLEPVLLLGCEVYRGPLRQFSDGTQLVAAQQVGILHFDNRRIADLGAGTRQGVGVRFARLFKESLQSLAERAQSDPKLKDVMVFHGLTWFKAHGGKVGFVSEALPPGLKRWWLMTYFRILIWGFTPVVGGRVAALEPRRFWITRGDLIKNFGRHESPLLRKKIAND